MDMSSQSSESVTCCICLDNEGTYEYARYWKCTSSHADVICRTCMLSLISNSSTCPLCRATNKFSIISIKNLNNYFRNYNITDHDVVNVITTLIYTRDIYNEL